MKKKGYNYLLILQMLNGQKNICKCHLPKIEDIKAFAEQRGLSFSAKPNGTLTTGIAIELMNYFADKAGLIEEKVRINEFFNVNYEHILTPLLTRSDILFYLGRQEANSATMELLTRR